MWCSLHGRTRKSCVWNWNCCLWKDSNIQQTLRKLLSLESPPKPVVVLFGSCQHNLLRKSSFHLLHVLFPRDIKYLLIKRVKICSVLSSRSLLFVLAGCVVCSSYSGTKWSLKVNKNERNSIWACRYYSKKASPLFNVPKQSTQLRCHPSIRELVKHHPRTISRYVLNSLIELHQGSWATAEQPQSYIFFTFPCFSSDVM